MTPRAPIEIAAAPLARSRVVASLVALLGFSVMMPYLSVSVGNNTAVQAGNIVTVVLAVIVLLSRWRRQPYWIYPVILAPMLIATLHVGLAGTGDISLSLKSVIVWSLSCVTIVVAQQFGARYLLALLNGIAVATILHALVGAWQWQAFPAGEFPLLAFYTNPSFLSLQDNVKEMALYMQRPFGLFPEPSAMASSLAPFVLLWIGWLTNVIRLPVTPSRFERLLYTVAAIVAVGLMIISKSGHCAVTLSGAMVFLVIWLLKAKPSIKTYLVTVCGFVMVTGVVVAAAVSLSERMGYGALGNGSWEDRFDSLITGLSISMGNGPDGAIFGMGPGQSTAALWKAARLDAVWSVLLTYVYETGFFGFLAVLLIGLHLVQTWRRTSYDIGFVVITLVWLVGITFATSYDQLLSLWLTLGLLSVWPEACAVKAAAQTTVPTIERAPPSLTGLLATPKGAM